MSYVAKDKEVDAPAPVKLHKIRITLTSRNVKSLEKMSNDLVNRSKDKKLHVKGPVRLPTKVLSHTTRKSPCGEGSKTWDHYEMRIHKRLIDIIEPSPKTVDSLQRLDLPAGVDIEIKIQDA